MMSMEAWENFAAERLAGRNGDAQLAWLDVLGATALLSRLYSPHYATQAVDWAVAGFHRALDGGR